MPDQTPPPAPKITPSEPTAAPTATVAPTTAATVASAPPPKPIVSATPASEAKPVAATVEQPVAADASDDEPQPKTPPELARIADSLHPSLLTLWIAARDLAAQMRLLIDNGKTATADELHTQVVVLGKILSAAAPYLSEHQKTVAQATPTDAASLEKLCRDIQVSIHQQ